MTLGGNVCGLSRERWDDSAPELWGGVECSVVRVRDAWRDQVVETGHHTRGLGDLDLLAGLGLRTLRYPVLWERSAPPHAAAHASTGCAPSDSDPWAWHDRQLEGLRARGIRIIAGLVHHGSGPPGTDLLDPHFPEKLAAHAAATAARYPFVHAWIPINEPLTTARFGCLYGHWHPHAADEGSFLRAVVNQCRAALLAMRAIRVVSPTARFVHTEDIGRVFATPPLAAQAAYENERRWLSMDLLCGRAGRQHPWFARLVDHGVPAAHLDELATGEAAPDLLGVNHYATSDRFLDHRLRLYPPHLRGGNGRQAYADTEALRADLGPDATGWAPRLREVWARYERPIAVTEVHLGCADPYEPVRWLMEAWHAVCALRAEGADIRAVTAWALLGLVDWNTMLRERRGHYEVSALDVRHEPPLATPLAVAIAALARDGKFNHPALDRPGWWRCDERVHESLRRA